MILNCIIFNYWKRAKSGLLTAFSSSFTRTALYSAKQSGMLDFYLKKKKMTQVLPSSPKTYLHRRQQRHASPRHPSPCVHSRQSSRLVGDHYNKFFKEHTLLWHQCICSALKPTIKNNNKRERRSYLKTLCTRAVVEILWEYIKNNNQGVEGSQPVQEYIYIYIHTRSN